MKPSLLRAPFVLSTLALALVALTGCGKKGPNQPPIRILPSPAQDLRVRQVGAEIRISARITMQRTDGTPLGARTQVRVLRMRATGTLRPGAVSAGYLERQFDRGAQTVATFAGQDLAKAIAGGRLRFSDKGVPVAPSSAGGGAFLYSILILDGEGKRSVLPPPLLIEPAPPMPVPHDLKIETAEGEIHLTWKPGEGQIPVPAAAAPRPSAAGAVAASGATTASGATPAPGAVPAPGSAPALLFNVYRKVKADTEESEAPLNRDPIEGPIYVDRQFNYGETYRYSVRALATRQAPLRESADSVEVEVRPLDIFPPAAPAGIAVAAEGGVIRIYWFPNSEPDLGGYRIYRRQASGGELQRLGDVGPAETSFADTTAKPGVRYYYAVTALDSATPPNESVRSEERSESLPAQGAPQPAPESTPATAPSASPTPARGRP